MDTTVEDAAGLALALLVTLGRRLENAKAMAPLWGRALAEECRHLERLRDAADVVARGWTADRGVCQLGDVIEAYRSRALREKYAPPALVEHEPTKKERAEGLRMANELRERLRRGGRDDEGIVRKALGLDGEAPDAGR